MHRHADALLLALLLSVSAFGQQAASPEIGALEKVIEDELAQTHTPGAAIVVVKKDDAVVYERGFGRASIEESTPVTTSTIFRLGSTTKMLTATAVLSLAASGKVILTNPVRQYVPTLDDQFARVNLRQLLSHSAGLCEAAPKIDSKDDDALKKEVDG